MPIISRISSAFKKRLGIEPESAPVYVDFPQEAPSVTPAPEQPALQGVANDNLNSLTSQDRVGILQSELIEFNEARDNMELHPEDLQAANTVCEVGQRVLRAVGFVEADKGAVAFAQKIGLDIGQVESTTLIATYGADMSIEYPEFEQGDDVKTVKINDWRTPEDGPEYRTHIGRSDDGWHSLVQTEQDAIDGHGWSGAYETRQEAEAAAEKMVSRFWPEHAHGEQLGLDF